MRLLALKVGLNVVEFVWYELGFGFVLMLIFAICECENITRGVSFSILLRLSPWRLIGFARYAFIFCFRDFVLAPSLLGASFFLKQFHLCFRNFVLALGLLGASFLPKQFCLHFRDFALAPALLGASFLTKRFLLCIHNFVLAPSLLGASFLSNYFCRANGWALNSIRPWL
jgi:hypothetical protein